MSITNTDLPGISLSEQVRKMDFITKGRSKRYLYESRLVYDFGWISRSRGYDTTAFTTTHPIKTSGGGVKNLTKGLVDDICREVVTEMKVLKKGKFYEPEYKEYSKTLIIYFITLEVIAALIWWFLWRRGRDILLIAPIVMVVLAMISISREIGRKARNSSINLESLFGRYRNSFSRNLSLSLKDDCNTLRLKIDQYLDVRGDWRDL